MWINKLSPRIVYASRAALLDADFADVSVGTDVTAALQRILDTASAGNPLVLVIDGVAKVKDLRLKSCTTLRGFGQGTGFVQAPGGTCAIRNYNWRSPYAGGVIADTDICVADLQINGNHDFASNNPDTVTWGTNENYYKVTPGAVGSGGGIMVMPLQLYGVRRLTLENLYINDPASYHVHIANIEYGSIVNLHFDDSLHVPPLNRPNTDGLHVSGPASDLVIRGLYGRTSDDLLALNAEDWNLRAVSAGLLYGPQLFGGSWNAVHKGPIVRLDISGLIPYRCLTAVRFYSGVELIDKVTVRGVRGETTLYGFQTEAFDSGPGNIGSICIEDVDIPAMSDADRIAFASVNCLIDKLQLRNIRRSNLNVAEDAIRILSAAAVNHLIVDGYTLSESSGASSDIVRMEGGQVAALRVSRVSWVRHPALGLAAKAVFRQEGGTVGSLEIDSCHIDGAAWAYAKFGGTCSILRLRGLTHLNSGGNLSVALDTGQTLPRLIAVSTATDALCPSTGIVDVRSDGSNSDSAKNRFVSAALAANLTAPTVWTDTGLQIVLPVPGQYRLLASIRSSVPAGEYGSGRLWDVTGAAVVGGPSLLGYCPGSPLQCTTTLSGDISTTVNNQIVKLQAKSTGAVDLLADDGNGGTGLLARGIK